MAFFRGCSDSNLSKHVECELKDMEHQLQKAGQANLVARLKMMVTSSGVRKAIMICLTAFVFTVATVRIESFSSTIACKRLWNFMVWQVKFNRLLQSYQQRIF